MNDNDFKDLINKHGEVEKDGYNDSTIQIALMDYPTLRCDFRSKHRWFEAKGIDSRGEEYWVIWDVEEGCKISDKYYVEYI